MKKNPFVNCGEKIKKLAISIFIPFMILSIIAGGGMLVFGFDGYDVLIAAGIAVLVIFPIAIYISCLFLYGFGEIVESAERQLDSAAAASNEIPEL